MLSKRSHQPEWMDLGKEYYTSSQYRDCLFQLDRIGRFLGGDTATFWAVKQLSKTPQSILDVGCGGGLFTMHLAKRYPKTKFVGIDISPDAITFAQERLNEEKPLLRNVEFRIPDSPTLDENDRYDVVMATLVCHHLSDQELVSFIQQACKVAKEAVIINDLHRHPFAYWGFTALVPFLFPNRMIYHDGRLSILRSFTRQEWKTFLQTAGIHESDYTITWHWAFRWIVMIDVTKMQRNSNGSL